MKKPILIVLVLALIIGGGYGFYMFNKKVPTLENVEADFVLTSNELFNAFDEDEMAAKEKFENKVIEVTGVILSIKNNPSDSSNNIILEADMAMAGGINCSFKQTPKGKIKKGNMATIKGQCQGFLMDVVLNNCQLIK